MIKHPISVEMKEFELRFRDALKSRVALLDRITYYIAHRKGKQMRPMFVFLAARMFGEINDSTYTAASMVELLHTATLVHDDVVDDSNRRRGFFSINALWKNKIAVLVGDYLFSRGFLISLENKEYQILEILSQTIKQMSEGELLQLSKARKLEPNEEVYFEIIRKKTASFFGAACSVGAASVLKEDERVAQVGKLGETIGMAFQIKDDLFDFEKGPIGKPRGIDIKEKKLTLPLIYALQQAPPREAKRILKIIKNQSHKRGRVQEVIDFTVAAGGLDYATKQMLRYRQEALDMLKKLPYNPARESFEQLLMYVTERKN